MMRSLIGAVFGNTHGELVRNIILHYILFQTLSLTPDSS